MIRRGGGILDVLIKLLETEHKLNAMFPDVVVIIAELLDGIRGFFGVHIDGVCG